jgi:hypothetical protein
MKFGSVAWLSLVVLVEVFARGLAQNCPLDNGFLSGRKTGTINPSRMQTLAGLAASRTNSGVLWGHAAGAADRIFAIATTSKAIADFTFNRTLTDAEDVAMGPGPAPSSQYIYVADCGGLRGSVLIGRFREPLVDASTSGTIPLGDQAYFTLSYPDGAHDARGLMIDPVSSDLLIVTYESTAARVYRATQQALASGNGAMTFVAAVPITEVTAADISADGSQIAMRSTTMALYWTRRAGQTIAEALGTAPHTIPVLDTFEFDGNSLAFAADGSGYYTTGQGFNPLLLFFERNRTRYTRGIGLATLDQGMMTEISGVAASRKNPGLLWIHDDGPRSELYLVDTNGQFFATFVFGQSTSDFEDIAIGPGPQPNADYVYCGDIGDNASLRTEVYVFRFPEPRVTQPSNDLIPAGESVITLVYPDGAHNAEALLVDSISGDLFIATKETGVFHLYKATQEQLNSGDVVQLALAQSGNFGPVSAGDISPDGSQIILRHETEARLWHRKSTESVEAALGRASEHIPVIGTPLEPNGEGVSFAPDSKSYYTISEVFPPVIYFFTPLAQPSFIKPPEIISGGVRITVSGCEGSRIRLDVSNNFASWSVAGSGYVANGVAIIDVATTEQALFYRAAVDDP